MLDFGLGNLTNSLFENMEEDLRLEGFGAYLKNECEANLQTLINLILSHFYVKWHYFTHPIEFTKSIQSQVYFWWFRKGYSYLFLRILNCLYYFKCQYLYFPIPRITRFLRLDLNSLKALLLWTIYSL